jgi:hypothetical protein
MPRIRTVLLATVASSLCAGGRSLLAQTDSLILSPVVTVFSPALRLRVPNSGLRIVVRDVDAPDQPVWEANVVVTSLDSAAGGRPTHSASSNERAIITGLQLATGDYSVLVRRIGYDKARFAVRLRAGCEQVLEVYIAQAIFGFDRCQVRTAGSPPCDLDPPPTPSRAVLTTCAHAG